MAHKPRRFWLMLLITMTWIGFVGHVEASDGMRGDHCVVGKDDYIVEDFYFVCRVLEVEGTIEGDLLGVASNITIKQTGVVTGDLWVGGGRLVISGTVGDDVHFAGINLSVSDKAFFSDERVDVVAAALNTEIMQGAAVPGDLLVYGYQARVDGTINGDIDFSGEALNITGKVGGNVDASVGDARRGSNVPGLPIYDVSFSNPGLRIEAGENTEIGGNLTYYSASRSRIPPNVVKGRTDYHQVLSQLDITKAEQPEAAAEILRHYFIASLRDVLTLLIVGGVGLWLVPNFVRQPAQYVQRRTIPAIGWGLIAFMLSFPVAILLILISLAGLGILVLIKLNELSVVVGVALLVLNLALIGGFWFLLLFMGRVVISFVIGQLFVRYVLRSTEANTLRGLQIGILGKALVTLLIGAAVYALAANVPLPGLGLTIELVTALAGIGAVFMYLREVVYMSRMVVPEQAMPALPTRMVMTSSPADHYEWAPGMENLPEGFTGFDD